MKTKINRWVIASLGVAFIGTLLAYYNQVVASHQRLGDICNKPKAVKLHPDSLHCRTHGDGMEFCYTGNQTNGLNEIIVRQKCILSNSPSLRRKQRETEYYCHGYLNTIVDCKFVDHKLAHGTTFHKHDH